MSSEHKDCGVGTREDEFALRKDGSPASTKGQRACSKEDGWCSEGHDSDVSANGRREIALLQWAANQKSGTAPLRRLRSGRPLHFFFRRLIPDIQVAAEMTFPIFPRNTHGSSLNRTDMSIKQ